MSGPAASPAPVPADGAPVRHFLSALQEALAVPAPASSLRRGRYLKLLEQRVAVARSSLARLLADPGSGALDYMSEGDHVRQTIADMPADSYRHRMAR